MMSAPNVGVAIPSTVSTSVVEGRGTTAASVTTTVPALVVTRSLALEFDAELPPGYERGQVAATSSRTGFSTSGSTITLSPATSAVATVVSTTSTQGAPLSSSSPVFMPVSGSRSYYYIPSQPVYTTSDGAATQHLSIEDNFQFPHYIQRPLQRRCPHHPTSR
ncbi:hypothetical protein Hanom_Chr03g00209711 [Helianthus anomalus]